MYILYYMYKINRIDLFCFRRSWHINFPKCNSRFLRIVRFVFPRNSIFLPLYAQLKQPMEYK